jgi:hypothetical protein
MLIRQDMKDCAQTCIDCADHCAECLAQCLIAGGNHVAPYHIRLLTDCATICRTTADFLARGSDHYTEICGACATISRNCAVDCREFEDDWMRDCARACDLCAESCETMAGTLTVPDATDGRRERIDAATPLQ